MTKQEQIEEMAKCVCNACEFGYSFDGDCAEGGTDHYKRCAIALETAERIYEQGYRRVLLDTEDGRCVDCVQYVPWQLVERKIKELETENEQLKAKHAEINAKLIGHERAAIRAFAEKLKAKFDGYEDFCLDMHDWQGQSAVNACIDGINELLKEVQNAEDKS